MSKPVLRPRFGFTAASAIRQYEPVTFPAAASALTDTVMPAGSINLVPIGVAVASAAAGAPVAVLTGGVGLAIAAASLGAGAQVAVGSTNGRLIPLLPSGGPASVNQVAVRFYVGVALQNAADAGQFRILVDPGQIV